MADELKRGEHQLPALCWQEGDKWIAACIPHDVLTQGDTMSEALFRLSFTLSAEEQMGDLWGLPPLPQEVVDEHKKTGVPATVRWHKIG